MATTSSSKSNFWWYIAAAVIIIIIIGFFSYEATLPQNTSPKTLLFTIFFTLNKSVLFTLNFTIIVTYTLPIRNSCFSFFVCRFCDFGFWYLWLSRPSGFPGSVPGLWFACRRPALHWRRCSPPSPVLLF